MPASVKAVWIEGVKESIDMTFRIAERVEMGGHGVPDKNVEKRYG